MTTNNTNVDAGTLAKIFDVSVSTVRDLGAKKIIVSSSTPGRYKLMESVAAYIQEMRRRQNSPGKGSPAKQLNMEKALAMRLKREREEIELEVYKGNLHKTEQVAKLVADMIVTARQKFLSLPSRLSMQLVGLPKAKIHHKIEDAVNEALAEMAKHDIDKELRALSEFSDAEIDYEEVGAGGDDDTS